MENKILAYEKYLKTEERATGTVEKYLRDLNKFSVFLDGRPVTKGLVTAWKEQLQKEGYAPVTVNSMLAAANGFLLFLDRGDCTVKYLKVQRRTFREQSRELTRSDYDKLIYAASRRKNMRLALLIETICATGIRVSEVKYITADAARAGKAEISLKGKIRTIMIPKKLSQKLLAYAKKKKIEHGEIFITSSGKSLSRRQIWGEMKALCKSAGVDARKVFPHNLRHLFARVFYKACRDIVKLADVLGHSSIDTTRIYLISTGAEHARQIEKLGLVT